MPDKHEIVVKEQGSRYSNFKMFNVSFETMKFYAPAIFDLFALNNSGYFRRLVENFKGKDRVCYLLFRALTWIDPGVGGASLEGIKNVLNLSTAYSTLIKVDPGESRLFKRLGEEIHIVMLRNDGFIKMQKIMNCIDSKGTWGIFIFASEEDKESLFASMERLFRNNSLGNQENLLALGFDIIKFGNQGLWAEYELNIFTNRYNSGQIKGILLDSMDKEKFEVRLI